MRKRIRYLGASVAALEKKIKRDSLERDVDQFEASVATKAAENITSKMPVAHLLSNDTVPAGRDATDIKLEGERKIEEDKSRIAVLQRMMSEATTEEAKKALADKL